MLIKFFYYPICFIFVVICVLLLYDGLTLKYEEGEGAFYSTTLNPREYNIIFDETNKGLADFFLERVPVNRDNFIPQTIHNFKINWNTEQVFINDNITYDLKIPENIQYLFEIFLSFK